MARLKVRVSCAGASSASHHREAVGARLVGVRVRVRVKARGWG